MEEQYEAANRENEAELEDVYTDNLRLQGELDDANTKYWELQAELGLVNGKLASMRSFSEQEGQTKLKEQGKMSLPSSQQLPKIRIHPQKLISSSPTQAVKKEPVRPSASFPNTGAGSRRGKEAQNEAKEDREKLVEKKEKEHEANENRQEEDTEETDRQRIDANELQHVRIVQMRIARLERFDGGS